MRYSETREASAEILRLMLQKMAAHPAAFTPLTYAVWYELISGINPALTEASNKLMEGGRKLDDRAIEQLHHNFVSDSKHEESFDARQEKINQLLSKLAGFTAETDKHANQFGNNLQAYGNTLKQDLDPAKLEALIGNMAGDTNKMRGSVQTLQSQLEDSKKEVQKLQRELKSARGEASTDPLTGVLNRRGFEAKAQTILDDAELIQKGLCLLMVDIDHFKKVNDTFGHLLGDKVIQAVATMLKFRVKGQDVVARLGGEEFAVLLPETDLAGARVVAEHIRQGIEKSKIRRLDTQDFIGGITVSLGISKYQGNTVVEMLDQADKALYQSKEGGRNRTTIFGQ
ncbi:MAG: diguanylate cyclase [Nitrosomonadales bacterium]|nr:diguanylate cyclase [Nitrosomonadales bacterium]